MVRHKREAAMLLEAAPASICGWQAVASLRVSRHVEHTPRVRIPANHERESAGENRLLVRRNSQKRATLQR
jgi:hypothetical protein